jgi:hypothetical protein
MKINYLIAFSIGASAMMVAAPSMASSITLNHDGPNFTESIRVDQGNIVGAPSSPNAALGLNEKFTLTLSDFAYYGGSVSTVLLSQVLSDTSNTPYILAVDTGFSPISWSFTTGAYSLTSSQADGQIGGWIEISDGNITQWNLQTALNEGVLGTPIEIGSANYGNVHLDFIRVWDGLSGTSNSFIENSVDTTVTSVPEPSTWAMLVFGFVGLGFAGYNRSKSERMALAV